MTKYDFELDLSKDTSTGILMSKIHPGSTVLEFGSAAGRMTRYMKETLGCRVYIVERDEEAYQKAMAYAEDGVCDDILSLSWLKSFGELRFDSILFADVLEHLTEPELALTQASQLLAENGRIYFSVPNITHNDIILKALDDRFDYTPIGLLDNTHVHFWGYKNLSPFVEKCGLHVHAIETTSLPTGSTEQYEDAADRPVGFLELLPERPCGEVYQFIVTAGREPALQQPWKALLEASRSTLHRSDGSGFTVEALKAENEQLCAELMKQSADNGKLRQLVESLSEENEQLKLTLQGFEVLVVKKDELLLAKEPGWFGKRGYRPVWVERTYSTLSRLRRGLGKVLRKLKRKFRR